MHSFFTAGTGDQNPRLKGDEIQWCGTSCCVAGLAVTMYPNSRRGEEVDADGNTVFFYEGHRGDVAEDAAKVLGMERDKAYVIFGAFVDGRYYADDGEKVELRWEEGATTEEEATLAYVKALIEEGEFFYPHEQPELFPAIEFEVFGSRG